MAEFNCDYCDKRFAIPDSQRKNQHKYCSHECYTKARWGESCRVMVVCAHCGKTFQKQKSQKKKFCSKTCRSAWQSHASRGSKNYRYKGGKCRHANGYWLVSMPHHPRATNQGYMFEHRLVMEKCLKRYLRADEIVHHINFNKADNRIDNLRLLSKGEHMRLHRALAAAI